jgi:hypothetical protein
MEERRTEAEEITETWRIDLLNIMASIALQQSAINKRDPKVEPADAVSASFQDFMFLCNNVHIVVHNILNTIIPLLP